MHIRICLYNTYFMGDNDVLSHNLSRQSSGIKHLGQFQLFAKNKIGNPLSLNIFTNLKLFPWEKNKIISLEQIPISKIASSK